MTELSKTNEEVQEELSLEAQIEALLFVAPNMVSVKQISDALGEKKRKIESGIKNLEKEYQSRGIRIQKHKGELKLTSAPELSQFIEIFLNLEATSRLSTAALECLSIVAYQQPITRPHIDSIRGVNSDGVIRNLLSNGLIEETGRAEGPGRPILYVSTADFLQHFGLKALEELPPLKLDALLKEQEESQQEIDQESLLKE